MMFIIMSCVISKEIFKSRKFFTDDSLRETAAKIDGYVHNIIPIIGDTRGTYWKLPYYLHILQEHVIVYLFVYRTLYPFAMTVHERLNKYGKDLFQHTMSFGGNYNKNRIYTTSDGESIVEKK